MHQLRTRFHKSRLETQRIIKYSFPLQDSAARLLQFRMEVGRVLHKYLLKRGTLDGNVQPWYQLYLWRAYKRGILRSYNEVSKGLIPTTEAQQAYQQGTHDQFLANFANTDTFRLLVEGTQLLVVQMMQVLYGQLSMTFTQAALGGSQLTNGDVKKQYDLVLARRGIPLVNAEIVRCHAEGQLDAFSCLGVQSVFGLAEIRSDKVCSACAASAQSKRSIKDARGVLPLHPYCGCAWSAAKDEK